MQGLFCPTPGTRDRIFDSSGLSVQWTWISRVTNHVATVTQNCEFREEKGSSLVEIVRFFFSLLQVVFNSCVLGHCLSDFVPYNRWNTNDTTSWSSNVLSFLIGRTKVPFPLLLPPPSTPPFLISRKRLLSTWSTRGQSAPAGNAWKMYGTAYFTIYNLQSTHAETCKVNRLHISLYLAKSVSRKTSSCGFRTSERRDECFTRQFCEGHIQQVFSLVVLMHCSDLTEIREKYFRSNSLRMLFRDVSLDSISDFLKEIDFIRQVVVDWILITFIQLSIFFTLWVCWNLVVLIFFFLPMICLILI